MREGAYQGRPSLEASGTRGDALGLPCSSQNSVPTGAEKPGAVGTGLFLAPGQSRGLHWEPRTGAWSAWRAEGWRKEPEPLQWQV